MNIRKFAIAMIASVGVAATAQADHHMKDGMKEKPTVTDIVVNSDQHTTLETAVVNAGLADTLAGKGPFTVFAPTDEAFAGLPEGTVESLLKQDNSEQLKNILTYHAVEGYYLTVSTLLALEHGGTDKPSVTALNGSQLTFSKEGDNIYVIDAEGNKAEVIATGIEASNGVVHVIDGVLMP